MNVTNCRGGLEPRTRCEPRGAPAQHSASLLALTVAFEEFLFETDTGAYIAEPTTLRQIRPPQHEHNS